jgi:hypothetical protein
MMGAAGWQIKHIARVEQPLLLSLEHKISAAPFQPAGVNASWVEICHWRWPWPAVETHHKNQKCRTNFAAFNRIAHHQIINTGVIRNKIEAL